MVLTDEDDIGAIKRESHLQEILHEDRVV